MIRARAWDRAMTAMKERLREPLIWYPYPLLISFALVMIFTAHVLFAVNPRMGSPADVLTFPSEVRKDGSIWLSVTPMGEDIVVTTGDRKVFRWRQAVRSADELKSLTEYLKEKVDSEMTSAAIAGKAMKAQVAVVLAVDQRLKYLHIRPILYSLAEAKITQYAFETNNPVVADANTEEHHGSGESHGGSSHE